MKYATLHIEWSDRLGVVKVAEERLTGDTILTVVEEENHAIGVHRLASVLHKQVIA